MPVPKGKASKAKKPSISEQWREELESSASRSFSGSRSRITITEQEEDKERLCLHDEERVSLISQSSSFIFWGQKLGADVEKKEVLDQKTTEDKFRCANNVTKSFKPLIILLQILGRWPLACRKNKDGTRDYQWKWLHLGVIYFCGVTLFVIYALTIGTWSMFSIVMHNDDVDLNSTKKAYSYEKIMLKRHIVTFVMLWTSLLHSCIASLTILGRRKYIPFYFSFWTHAMPVIFCDAAKGTFRFVKILVLSYIGVIAIFIILSATRTGPTAVSSPTIFGILMFRDYLPPLYKISTDTVPSPPASNNSVTPSPTYKYNFQKTNPSGHYMVNILGAIFILLVFASSKVYMFVFMYKCRLLKNGFAQWNARMYASVLKASESGPKRRLKKNSTFSLLFRDHCVLLDLLEATDTVFATIMESFFVLQVISLCFETYFFLRTARFGDDRTGGFQDYMYFIRPYDWLPAALIFLSSIALLMAVCLSAAAVGEEVMAGMEVLRRRTLMGRKTNDELYFMMTMFGSYTAYRQPWLMGAGYCYITKEFLVGVTSAILSYFIIVYQFGPPLDYKSTDFQQRRFIGMFLSSAEQFGPEDHYNTLPPGSDGAVAPSLV